MIDGATTKSKDQADAPKARRGVSYGGLSRDLDVQMARFHAQRGTLSDRGDEVDPPFAAGMQIMIVSGNGTRRQDVVGLRGFFCEKVVRKTETVYTFELETGEVVNSHEVWWQRITP